MALLLLCSHRKYSSIQRQDVQFALGVLGKAGDVFGLFEERSVVRELAVFLAQAVNGSQGEVSIQIHARSAGYFFPR